MTNSQESRNWLRDAEDSLNRAKKLFELNDFRGTIQSSQMVVEGAVKAVIACFGVPEWDHDPSDQLREIIERYKEKLIEAAGEKGISMLELLAKDAEEIAPWHGKSVYGEILPTGEHISAIDICDKKTAKQMLEKAERSYEFASNFLKSWFQPA